jgi:RHS repeat-associated protein
VKAEGSSVKQYQFNYGFDNIHSMLKEVIETGSDGSQLNSTIFRYGDQPVNFSVTSGMTFGSNVEFFSGDFNGDGKTDLVAANYYYKSNDPTRYHSSYTVKNCTPFNSPVDFYSYSLPTNTSVKSDKKDVQSFLTSDYNKDGRDDILMINLTLSGSSGTFYKTNINYTTTDPSTGAVGKTTSPDFGVPYVYPYSYGTIHQKGNYFLPGDFDGDGNEDYILILGNSRYAVLGANEFKAFLTSPGTGEVNQEINNFGFGTNSNPQFYAATVAGADMITASDIDGDGKAEILVTKDYLTYVLSIKRTSFSTGYYFAASVLFYTSEITKDSKIFPGDFNGDGKNDWLVRNSNGTWKILYSMGSGFKSVPFSFNQTVTLNNDEFNPGDRIIIADFNGDGKSDILHGYWPDHSVFQSKLSVYYSRGVETPFYYEQYDYNNVLNQYAVGDFNGDGRSDLVNVTNFQNPVNLVEIKARGKERLLSQIANGHNYNTWIDYTNLTDPNVYNRTVSFTDPANTNPYNYVQLPLYAVSAIYTPNDILGTNVTSYSYEDAVVHRAGRGLLGFRKITATDQTKGITSVTQNAINTQFAQAYPTSQTTKLTSTGETLTESQFTTSFVDLGSNRFWEREDKILNIDYLSGSATETTNTYDNYGNITTAVSKTGSFSGTTVSPIETATTTTTYSVHNTPVPAKADQVTVSRVRNGSPSDNVTLQYYYNGTGLVSSQIQYYGTPKAITTSYSYNSFGNPTTVSVSASGVNSRVTNVTFDSKGRFALTKEVAAGTTIAQSESMTWDPKWGKPLSQTSSDCLTTQYEYDGYGRIKKTTDPVFTTNSSLVWDIQAGNLYYNLIHYTGGRPDEKTWFDVFERPTIKQVMGFNNQWMVSNLIYDERGNLASSSNMHYSGETPLMTANTYDAYNRLHIVTTPMNTVTYTYNKLSGGNFQVVITDQSGQTSSKITDAAGRVISSNDKGGDLYFTYDSRGLQTEVKHGSVSLVTTSYDTYGREATQVDKNAGTITYVYDALGELTNQTDNSSHAYQMTYDELGRLTSRQGPEGTTTYEYYKDVNGCRNNSLTKVMGFNGVTKEYTYDNLKRLQTEKVTVDNTAYLTQYSYDSWSNISKITYPSGVEVNNTFDNNGFLSQVTGGNPGSQTTLFNGTQMNGFGQFTAFTLGNGKTTQVSYQNGFATRYYTQGVQDLNLSWDYARGNLNSRQDAIKGLTESFQYDGLNRLTQTSVNGQMQLNIGYDGNGSFSMGNISSKTDAGLNYTYRDDKIHAVAYITYPNAISQSTVGQTIGYTPFFKAATITEDSYQMDFTYDPDYERIKTVARFNGGVTETKYYLGNYERQTDNNGTREIHYVTGGNGLCAIIVRENGVNSFYIPYSDHLGSILTLTDVNGNIVTQQNFDAWGRKRNPNDWTYNNIPSVPAWLYRGFTGHEHLSQFALINMNGRLYDPIQGRMLSPDNYVSDDFQTQAYNRYTYGLNNPLSYIDPDGNNPVVVAIIIGAAIGAYSGGTIANNGQLNPLTWNWNSGRTWAYVLGGAAIGAGSGYLGATVAASGMPFANTAGIISSSFANSVGMNILTGGAVPVAVGLGAASYSFQSGNFNYLGERGNSFLANVGFAFGAMSDLQDIMAGIHGINATYRAESEAGIPHARLYSSDDDYGDVDVSAAHVGAGPHNSKAGTELAAPNYKCNGCSGMANGLDYAQAWLFRIVKGEHYPLSDYKGPMPKLRVTFNNINGKLLAKMTQHMKDGVNKFGGGRFLYGSTILGCQSHVAHALWLVGVPTLPINIHPIILFSQLAIRQAGIFASPYLINH